MAKRKKSKKPVIPFPYKLVLNQWLLSRLGVDSLEKLAEYLKNEALEGLDENNVHRFHHALTEQLFNLTEMTTETLLEYDQNIVRHTQQLNEPRITRGEEPLVWKYFQYLSLLFTEIYLDEYFRDPEGLRQSINSQVATYNEDKDDPDKITPLDESVEAWPQLNKLAFWMATGSGKTLLMHANVLQYQFYLDKHGRQRDLNRILLLTPNEGLSQQHKKEFDAAGIDAEMFKKDGGNLFSGKTVEIIEVTLLRDEEGEKTVAIDAFEGNNLVLVDEGHRGASSGTDGTWMRARNALCEKGFSFEYSATFQQAITGNAELTDLYAKNILFNYSYRYFYGDGFGKDYQILNLDEGTQDNHLELYMTACLLTFFQQQRLFKESGSQFRPFNIAKPLWIFVGGSVTKTLAKQDASDIVEILKFLARFVSQRSESIKQIKRVLNQGLVTTGKKNLFSGRFAYLNTLGLTPTDVFNEVLSTLFNASGGGQLYVENLKGATGEVALRIGAENEPFGVINVGDDAKLVKLCEQHELQTSEPEFSGSLFHKINDDDSTVNILIGSKKFTEGWSSWRVSTMGLMNVGRGAGAQIIQLFGRGVRLKGYEMSLKRSTKTQLPDGVVRPKHISTLETLGIFGIRADYMADFRRELEKEGLPTNEERFEFLLPVIKNLGTVPLKTIRLQKKINGVSTEFGDAFRKLGPIPTVMPPDPQGDEDTAYLQKNQVVVNWYPKIKAMKSDGVKGGDTEEQPNRAHFAKGHTAFLDVDKLYFELERFKAERGWYNLNLTRDGIVKLLSDQSWYELFIPPEELAFDSYEKVRLWQEIALSLLRKYTERYYTFRKRQWEMPYLEYQELGHSDLNLLGIGETKDDDYYRIMLDESQIDIIAKLKELKQAIQNGKMQDVDFAGLKTLWFGRHLYQPLLCLKEKIVEISPAPLNKGERRFIEDLSAFHTAEESKPKGFFKGKELYLLRNLSRGKGVGFFEAGNFHPDFILWMLVGKQQHIIFVDPKGIRQIGVTDPKVQFYETIKEIETRLGDKNTHLHSFLVSGTASHMMRGMWGLEKDQMEDRNIVFQEEDRERYIEKILTTAISSMHPSGVS